MEVGLTEARRVGNGELREKWTLEPKAICKKLQTPQVLGSTWEVVHLK
jgi:hypothetical protein